MTGSERLRAALERWLEVPQEDWLEFVERGLDAFWDPDIVICGATEWSQTDLAGPFVGHQQVLEFWQTWLTSWATMDAEIIECFDEGDLTFLVLAQTLRGQVSDIEIALQYVWAVRWRGDRIWRLQFATSLEGARALVAGEPAS